LILGYVGRAVVKELVTRGIPTTALVRSSEISQLTQLYLKGAEVIQCNVQDETECERIMQKIKPKAVVCCLGAFFF